MGFFKKIFKPVRKVLDKVIPNEIKPALPYLAAFTPFLAPTSGMFGTMAGRAFLSGGANIAAQLAQEGTTEDDLNLLSAGIAAATGALSAPGAGDKLSGMTTKGKLADMGIIGSEARMELANRGLLQKGIDLGLTGASKAADFLSVAKGSGGVGDILRPGGTQLGFNKASAMALGVPIAQGTGDAMYSEAVRFNKQQIIDDALSGLGEGATDADRALAIRLAMEQYGFGEDEISETISAAGYRSGGRVRLDSGGGLGALARGMQGRKGESSDLDLMTIKATLNQVHTNNDDGEGGGMAAVMEFMEKNPEYRVQVMENIIGDRGDKIRVAPIEETPINILDGMNTDSISIKDGVLVIDSGMFEKKAKGGRVGFKFGGGEMDDKDKKVDFGGLPEAIKNADFKEKKESMKMASSYKDPMLVAEYKKYVFDLKEQRPDAIPMSFEEFKAQTIAGMKDGGLMNLGGKEMDLRGGGFVPIGKKERADDVPARLSKNEFVMTADAVRAAGGGSVNKGAKRMYDLMNNLEARV